MGVEELFGEPKKVELETYGSKKRFMTMPVLTGLDMAKLMKKGKDRELESEDVNKLVLKVLKENYPNASMSDVDKLPMKTITEILTKLFEVNGFPSGSKTAPLSKGR